MSQSDSGGSERNYPTCPKCGGDYFRGAEVGDYCIDCKTIFRDDADDWSLSTDT